MTYAQQPAYPIAAPGYMYQGPPQQWGGFPVAPPAVGTYSSRPRTPSPMVRKTPHQPEMAHHEAASSKAAPMIPPKLPITQRHVHDSLSQDTLMPLKDTQDSAPPSARSTATGTTEMSHCWSEATKPDDWSVPVGQNAEKTAHVANLCESTGHKMPPLCYAVAKGYWLGVVRELLRRGHDPRLKNTKKLGKDAHVGWSALKIAQRKHGVDNDVIRLLREAVHAWDHGLSLQL